MAESNVTTLSMLMQGPAEETLTSLGDTPLLASPQTNTLESRPLDAIIPLPPTFHHTRTQKYLDRLVSKVQKLEFASVSTLLSYHEETDDPSSEEEEEEGASYIEPLPEKKTSKRKKVFHGVFVQPGIVVGTDMACPLALFATLAPWSKPVSTLRLYDANATVGLVTTSIPRVVVSVPDLEHAQLQRLFVTNGPHGVADLSRTNRVRSLELIHLSLFPFQDQERFRVQFPWVGLFTRDLVIENYYDSSRTGPSHLAEFLLRAGAEGRIQDSVRVCFKNQRYVQQLSYLMPLLCSLGQSVTLSDNWEPCHLGAQSHYLVGTVEFFRSYESQQSRGLSLDLRELRLESATATTLFLLEVNRQCNARAETKLPTFDSLFFHLHPSTHTTNFLSHTWTQFWLREEAFFQLTEATFFLTGPSVAQHCGLWNTFLCFPLQALLRRRLVDPTDHPVRLTATLHYEDDKERRLASQVLARYANIFLALLELSLRELDERMEQALPVNGTDALTRKIQRVLLRNLLYLRQQPGVQPPLRLNVSSEEVEWGPSCFQTRCAEASPYVTPIKGSLHTLDPYSFRLEFTALQISLVVKTIRFNTLKRRPSEGEARRDLHEQLSARASHSTEWQRHDHVDPRYGHFEGSDGHHRGVSFSLRSRSGSEHS